VEITKGGVLWILSWIIALYFGVGFVAKAGFPPNANLLIGDALFVGLTLFFLFLPFFDKIKIASWIEIERKVEEAKKEAVAAKEELREFKTEVRTTMSVVSSNSIRQNINVQIQPNAIREQGAQVEQNLGEEARRKASAVESELQAEPDVNVALAKVRIDIERLLRGILGATLKTPNVNKQTRYLTIPKMLDQLIEHDESYAYLAEPMKLVLTVCNAAIHAQYVTKEQADEALLLGSKVIAALKQHPGADAERALA
jgi:hypothetical protein